MSRTVHGHLFNYMYCVFLIWRLPELICRGLIMYTLNYMSVSVDKYVEN